MSRFLCDSLKSVRPCGPWAKLDGPDGPRDVPLKFDGPDGLRDVLLKFEGPEPCDIVDGLPLPPPPPLKPPPPRPP